MPHLFLGFTLIVKLPDMLITNLHNEAFKSKRVSTLFPIACKRLASLRVHVQGHTQLRIFRGGQIKEGGRTKSS